MIAVVISGAGFGLGVFLLWRALTARPSLAEVQARLDRPGRPLGSAPSIWARREVESRIAAAAIRQLRRVGIDPAGRAEDLAVTRTSTEAHVLSKLSYALAGFVAVLLLTAVLAVWGVPVVAGAGLVVAVVFAAAGFAFPDLVLADRAKRERRAFRHAYGAYLDLVELMVAAGAGPESALADAADAGDGPAFEAIRHALAEAKRSRRLSVWQALGELGRSIGVVELSQLAGSATLVATEGARVRDSLVAQADSLRAGQLAEAEAEAESATEHMVLPLLVLLIGFLLFIGYPAVAAIAELGT